jgi:D-alanyl-D-alanine carboxypeptidase
MVRRFPGRASHLEVQLLAGLARGLLRAPGWIEAQRIRALPRLWAAYARLPVKIRWALLTALAGTQAEHSSAASRPAPIGPADRLLLQQCLAIARTRGLPSVAEAPLLIQIGRDRYGRRHWLRPDAARALSRLHTAATGDGVALEVVSSFRSIADQLRIIRRKLARGEALAEILAVNAPPGCSEHHGGGAVDFAVPGEPPLTEAFEDTPAFAWLHAHAGSFGFRLSYPRDNCFGYRYEPWHWCYHAAS